MFLTRLNTKLSLRNRTQRFIKNKDGASAIEYVIVAAMVAVVAIAFISPIGDAITTKLTEITEGLGGTAPAKSP